MSAPATPSPSKAEDPLGQKPAGETGFLDPVLSDLAAVEVLLNEEIRSDVRAAYAISGHTLSAGGKRLRPALLVLSARAAQCAYPARTITASASAAELIHMASLIHDDVVDSATERRGRPTAKRRLRQPDQRSRRDYLLAKSIYLAAREGNIDVIRVFSNVTIGLSEGEVLQITAKGDVDTTEETYRKIIEKKTAGFIAGCCEIGGMLAEAPPESIAALASYGMNCGLAFQVADDLLDYTGDPKITGKALDGDLREGKMTLPLILAVRDASESEREELMQTLQTPEDLSSADIARVHQAIENCDGYRRTLQAAQAYAQSAKDALSVLPASSLYRDSLAALADYAVARQR